jgi:uncharacterized repeat protein (TIGR03803 family)
MPPGEVVRRRHRTTFENWRAAPVKSKQFPVGVDIGEPLNDVVIRWNCLSQKQRQKKTVYCALAVRGSVRSVFVVALATALLYAPCVPARAQTGSAAAPSWQRGPQGVSPLPAPNVPGQLRLRRPHGAASAQTSSSPYTESVLYGFSGFCTGPGCANGTSPAAGLIEDTAGNLYGTTSAGGASVLFGTVFKLTPNGSGGYTESVLYNFCSQGGNNCTDGANPLAGLIEDASGNLYGTTAEGGANYNSTCYEATCGTVFKLAPNGDGSYSETVLYSFCAQGGTACTDGGSPLAGLIEDASGNLYGTTWHGGATIPYGSSTTTAGTVFKLAPNGNGSYSESVLYSFCSQSGCADGEWPESGLIEDASGNLYGTTSNGGATITVSGNSTTGGTVFKLTPKGDGSYSESVLYSFCSQSGCTDGLSPSTSLIEDTSGNLYGTTWLGGTNCQYGYAGDGCGTVFKLAPNGDGGYSENVLYSFCAQGGAGCPDGFAPSSGLIEDASGNLYGTTSGGGVYYHVQNDGGTVFELTPSGTGYTETVLYSFCALSSGNIACADGSPPQGGVIEDASGNLYGTTNSGGPNSYGTVFKLAPPVPAITVSVSPTSLTIKAGQSGTATLTVTPSNGFNSAVSFTCSGLPLEASCSFSPPTVTPSGGNPATTTITISTTAPSAALRRAGRGPQLAYAWLLPVLGLVGAALGKGARRGLRLPGLLVLLGLVLALASCGGSGSSGGGGNTGTPPGTSTVTVTAGVAGGTSQTASLTLIVTQ